MDIIVTTPKSESQIAAEEAAYCLKIGGGFYYRTMHRLPKDLNIGDKVFYVEDGFVRGFAVVYDIDFGDVTCDVSSKQRSGNQIIMKADSWKWIQPIAMRGFQGWRYFSQPYTIVGDWKDPKPTFDKTSGRGFVDHLVSFCKESQ